VSDTHCQLLYILLALSILLSTQQRNWLWICIPLLEQNVTIKFLKIFINFEYSKLEAGDRHAHARTHKQTHNIYVYITSWDKPEMIILRQVLV
jgi:hypothetical protein